MDNLTLSRSSSGKLFSPCLKEFTVFLHQSKEKMVKNKGEVNKSWNKHVHVFLFRRLLEQRGFSQNVRLTTFTQETGQYTYSPYVPTLYFDI